MINNNIVNNNEDITFVKEKNLFKDDIVQYQSQYWIVVRVAWDHDNLDTDVEMKDENEITDSNNQLIEKKKKSKFYSTDEIVKDNQDGGSSVGENKEGKEVEGNEEEADYGEDDDEDEDEEDEEQLHDGDSEYDYYNFKNNESGVLLLGISNNVLTEVDYDADELFLFDRKFYLTDSVQKINSDCKLLGSIINWEKKYFIVPFEIINTGTITQADLVILDKVQDTSSLVVGSKVTDLNTTVAGLVESVKYDLECYDTSNPNKIVKIKNAESMVNVFFHKIYNNDDTFCPGKIIFSKSKKRLIIKKVIPIEAEVSWLYYFDNDPKIISSTQPIDKLKLFSDSYEVFNCNEPIVYKDVNEIEKGGYIILTKSNYSVVWQDGEITLEESTGLMICDALATDYFPGQIICSSGMDIEDPYNDSTMKWGVVISSKPTERTCTIQWNNLNHKQIKELSTSTTTPIYLNTSEYNGIETFIENDVSVYDIEYFEDYNFEESDYVCKLDEYSLNEQADILGQVIGRDGLKLKICWNNGFMESVYPFELTKVDDFDQEDEEEDDFDQDDQGSYDDSDDASFEKFEEFKDSLVGAIQEANEIKVEIKKIENEIEKQPQQEILQQVESTTNSSDELPIQIENGCAKFEILKEFEVHNFMEEKGNAVNKKLLNAINKEFEILSTSLPPGIFVRANSSKIQLLSAMIIGPADTIYENSVFIFDIYLPSQYPMVAPKVFYHSVSFKLHPNLYVNGTVCLSLLGTWHGNKNEMWVPDVSNLLQILISIQGLILGCKEPYFLEAGYDTQIGTHIGIRNSSIFNEDSYLLSLDTILFYLKNQPTIFKQVIKNHLNSKKQDILSRIDQFLNATTTPNNNGITSLFSISLPPNLGFLAPLKKIKTKIQECNLIE